MGGGRKKFLPTLLFYPNSSQTSILSTYCFTSYDSASPLDSIEADSILCIFKFPVIPCEPPSLLLVLNVR